jgi:hypothetical protein
MTAMLNKNIKFIVKDMNGNLCLEDEIRSNANFEEVSHIEMEDINGVSTMVFHVDYENGAIVKTWNVSVNFNFFEEVEITCSKNDTYDDNLMLKKVTEAVKDKKFNITVRDIKINNIEEAY